MLKNNNSPCHPERSEGSHVSDNVDDLSSKINQLEKKIESNSKQYQRIIEKHKQQIDDITARTSALEKKVGIDLDLPASSSRMRM